MALSSRKDRLFCPIRRTYIVNRPEEVVRLRLLNHLIDKLQFPKEGLSVEKALSDMPHLGLIENPPPNRRSDIISFAKGIHKEYELFPLLLIECKAGPLTQSALNQLIGYNHYVKSYFVALANDRELKMGWYDKEKGGWVYIPYIPRYDQLLRSISK